jgi:cyanophycinase
MSIHLVGGGYRDDAEEAVYGGFVDEAMARVGRDDDRAARVAVLTVRDEADPEHGERFAAILGRVAGARQLESVLTVIDEGERMRAAALESADGILVGGGLTPAYLTALVPLAAGIRSAVESGVPYLGFSAGAAIAPDRALVGGWRIGDVEVADEDSGEDLEEVTVLPGRGLIDVTIDVHAVQWGNLTRAIAAVDSGVVGEVIAIDESTVLTVGSGLLRAGGAGTVWVVTRDERGVLVRSMR